MEGNDKFHSLEQIIYKLMELDMHCSLKNIDAKLVILGGSGILINLAMQGTQFRSTNDIDVETIAATDIDSFSKSLAEFKIQTVGGIMDVPPMEDLKNQENLYKIEGQGFTNLDVYVPSLELLACCKIFSKREKDLYDLKDTNLLDKCDKSKLLSLIEEYKPYTLNIDDPFLNLHELANIFSEKGI